MELSELTAQARKATEEADDENIAGLQMGGFQ